MSDDNSSPVAKSSDFAASARAYDAAVPGAKAGTKAAAMFDSGAPIGRKSAESIFHVTAEKLAAEHKAQTAMMAEFEAAYPKSAASYRKAKGL